MSGGCRCGFDLTTARLDAMSARNTDAARRVNAASQVDNSAYDIVTMEPPAMEPPACIADISMETWGRRGQRALLVFVRPTGWRLVPVVGGSVGLIVGALAEIRGVSYWASLGDTLAFPGALTLALIALWAVNE